MGEAEEEGAALSDEQAHALMQAGLLLPLLHAAAPVTREAAPPPPDPSAEALSASRAQLARQLQAARILLSLCRRHDCRVSLVAAGAIRHLLAALDRVEAQLQRSVLLCLEQLARPADSAACYSACAAAASAGAAAACYAAAQASELHASELQASELQASELQASELQASELQASELQASELQASELQASELHALAALETVLGCAFSTQAGVRSAALGLLLTLSRHSAVCRSLSLEAPASALLALLRMDLDREQPEPLALCLDLVRSIAADQQSCACFALHSGSAAQAGELLSRLQATASLPSSLRATAAAVRCALSGEALEVLQLPPTQRQLRAHQQRGALTLVDADQPAERGAGAALSSVVSGVSGVVSDVHHGVDGVGEAVSGALRKLSVGAAEFALGGRPGRTRG